MNAVNLTEYLRGKALITGIEDIVRWSNCLNPEFKEQSKTNFTATYPVVIKWALENWPDVIQKLKERQSGGGWFLEGFDTSSTGIKAHSKLLGGCEVLVTWADMRKVLSASLEVETTGHQISILDIFGAGFYQEVQK